MVRLSAILVVLLCASWGRGAQPIDRPVRPNILLAIADDVSWRHLSVAGCRAVRTPNIDRLARIGVRFEHAFCPAPACAPSRASLLAGRAPWQNGEAACHFAGFPRELATYPEELGKVGYHVGSTGKGWGPGDWKASGRPHNPAGPEYQARKLAPPPGISAADYAANFTDFLAKRPKDAPFCFWFGAAEAHRGFGSGEGLKRGKRLADAELPPFLPDSPAMRGDFLDYCVEIEWFDDQLGKMVKQLETAGELDNTLIVVTADNGMPFPRAKSNLYDYGARVPLVVAWPRRVPGARVVDDFATLADLAPTFLEAAGGKVPQGMTARSLLPLLTSARSGRVEAGRDHVVLAKERHAWCQPNGEIAAMRAIRTGKYLFIRNLFPKLWPSGDPDPQYNYNLEPFGDVDGGADRRTAKYLLMTLRRGPDHRLWELTFAPRPAEELYDLSQDASQMKNVAADPSYAKVCQELRSRLSARLAETGDPRARGKGELFDRAPYHFSQGLATAGMAPARFLALGEAERVKALEAARRRADDWPATGDLPPAIARQLAVP